ncbi:hypothetical protein GCM10028807_43100 [Spirosoma daeguense]
MTTNDIYDVLTDAISSVIPDNWTIARLTIHFFANGQEIEFGGIYLTPDGEAQPLLTDFPEEVTEAVQQLYVQRKNEGQSDFNQLQIDLTVDGKFTADFSWDQEIQDEDDHFSNGGTAHEWMAIREAKYGSPDEPKN